MAAWVIKPEKKMTLEEVRTIAADIQRRAKRRANRRKRSMAQTGLKRWDGTWN